MKRLLRPALFALAALVVLTLLGYFVLPRVLHAQLEARLTELLLRPTTVRAVRFDPLDVRLEVEGLTVVDHDAPRLLAFEKLVVDVEASQLWLLRLAFEELTLEAPYVRVVLEPGGRLNVSDILAAQAARQAAEPPAEPEPEPRGELPVVRVARLALTKGVIDLLDRRQRQPFATQLSPLEISLRDFTTEPEKNSPYAFEVRFDGTTRVAWEGDFSINPLRSSGRLALSGLRLASFAPYLRDATQLVVRGGAVDMAAAYRFDASSPTVSTKISGGTLSVSGLELGAPGREAALVSLQRVAVGGVEVDVERQAVRTGSVAVRGLSLALERDAAGQLDLLRWAAPPARTASVAARATPPPSRTASASPARPDAPWSVVVAGLGLSEGVVRLSDRGIPLDLELDQISVRTAPLTVPLAGRLHVALGLRVQRAGRVEVEGDVPLTGGPLGLDVRVEDLPLALAQPFVAPHARVELAKGALSLGGRLELDGPRTTYRGALAVRQLSVMESQADREVLGLEELSLTGIELALPPVVATVETLRLAGLRTQLVVSPDGKNNYAALAVPAPPSARAASAEAAAPAAPPQVTIGALVLDKLRADYLDRSVSPPFSVKLSALSGRIAPVRWPADRSAKVDLSGRVDAAPLTVKGTVRPAGSRATMDLAIVLQGLDLLATSTYFAKYAGYPVTKGKLSLDLAYSLADRKLDGKNVVVVDQLTLGDKVESPDATWLPVKLGLAILTDKRGRMELDLPVSGDLDDPEFSVGKIVLRALVNVLEKVATSPFALLGAVMGGDSGPPPDRVPFAVGSSTLTPGQLEALSALVGPLSERPALRLAVGGTYDGPTDGEALARQRLASRFRDELKRAGAKSPVVDDATWAARIRALYTARVATRSATRTPTLAEMEAAVLAGETPSNAELAALADARARAVQARLVEALGAERVFVIVPAAPTSADRAVVLTVE